MVSIVFSVAFIRWSAFLNRNRVTRVYCSMPSPRLQPVPGFSRRARRFGAAELAGNGWQAARAQAWERQVKVSPTFSKVAGCGTASHDLLRLRQTQEGRKGFLRKSFRRGLRFRSGRSWARATGTQDPSSGGAGARWAPFSADRAGRRDRAAHRARPGRGATPRGGHPSPHFC